MITMKNKLYNYIIIYTFYNILFYIHFFGIKQINFNYQKNYDADKISNRPF